MKIALISRISANLPGTLVVAQREIRDQLRDWRILSPIILLTLFFPILMNFTAQQAVGFVEKYGANIIADRLIPFLLMVVGFFPISISLVIALESFAGERERLSLEPLLSTPLTDVELYFGKMLASLLLPISAAFLGIFVYLIGLYLGLHWVPPAQLLIQVLLLTLAQAVVMVSGAVVISSQTTSVRAANLLASFIILPMSQLIIGESMIMFWGRYSILWLIIFALLLLAVVVGRMGLHLFNRENLLGREIDVLNFRWAWSHFKKAFLHDARNLRDWYRDLFAFSLRRARGALLLTFLALSAAYFIGFGLSRQFTLPAKALQLDQISGFLADEFGQLGFMSSRGWLWIMLTNSRAVLLATVFGLFSLGVLGELLLMIPIALTGYIAGNLSLANQDVARFLIALVVPHATLEVPAALLAGAAILQLGMSLMCPPNANSLSENLLSALAEWARISIGIVLPLLIGAAIIEAFLTPRIALLMLAG
jgi:uncharacterized membrane protein SpoIIM required for sporulation/ABC-type transport system involved in multi-copper enzyme maturation permease subunit